MAEPADPVVRLWAMPVGALQEPDVERWREVLDDAERARAARFAFERNRVEYVSAHALTRALLGLETGEPPTSFGYRAGEKGKPVALCRGRPVGVHFNLSHTGGMVAVAATHGLELGLDVEAIDRKVDLGVADRYFFGAEAQWLAGLAPERRPEGFLRLWTLKEAYIKATGRGLSQPLDEFWFEVEPPRIRFTAAIADDDRAWRFHQQVLAGRFLVAAGWRAGEGPEPRLEVRVLEPAELTF